MPVTGTRHKSHNLSSDLTASHFASQKPPNYVFSPVTETLWRIITFYGPQEISVANAQNWECLSSLFIQVPKRLILVWIRMICQVRTISFKASSLHPIHPSTKCSPRVPGTQVNTIKNSEMGQAICHPFWTMDNVGRVSLNVSVCDILIRREGLHHCDYWLVSSLSWVPNQTGLCSEQSGSDCCDCPRTVLSLNTQIHNSNEYTKLGSQENKAKIGVLIDTNIILIMGHSLIIEIDFAHRLNKLKFFPLLNLKIEPVRFSQYYYC